MEAERCSTASGLPSALVKNDPSTEITVFLMADAVACAKRAQKTPDGYYNLERMLKRFVSGSHRLLLCGTCMDARGLTEPGLARWRCDAAAMNELAKAAGAADKVIVF